MRVAANSSHPIQFYLLLILIFWLPIPLGSNRPWAWAIMEIASFSLMLSYCLSTQWSVIRERLFNYRLFILILAVFACWQLIQAIPLPSGFIEIISPNSVEFHRHLFSESGEAPVHGYLTISLDSTQSLIMFIKTCAYLCMACLIFLHVDSVQKLKLLITVIVCTGLFQAVYGSLALLESHDKSWFLTLESGSNATGTFINRNHFANFILLSASLTTGWLISKIFQASKQESGRNSRALRSFLTGFVSGKFTLRLILASFVIALVLSHSRMGNGAFFIALTLTVLICLIASWHKSTAQRRKIATLFISILVIDALILGSWFGIDKVKTRIEQTSIVKETRDNVALDSFALIKQFPIAGVGGGGFYSTYVSVSQSGVKGFYDHAHNDYLQFATEYGLVVSSLMLYLLLASLRNAIVALRNRHRSFIKGTAVGCFMATISMMLHISVEFNLQVPANSMLFIIILCVSWICRYGLETKKSTVREKQTNQDVFQRCYRESH